MILPAVVCPPAPRKPAGRRPVPCKRRLRRVALFKILAREEIECFFRVAEDDGSDSKRRCMRHAFGFFKVNADASFHELFGLTEDSMIVRNDDGVFVLRRTIKRQGLMLVDEGEAWGLLEALNWISDLGRLEKVEMETNSKRLCDAIDRASCDYDSPYVWVEPPDFVDELLDSICYCNE
ncbi:hypothetical protein ACS0TY_031441 [Phlomoides rotata]